jgi:hypothetical protein
MAAAPAYKRTHSAMNTKVLIPAIGISGGKVVGAGEAGQLPADPLELVKSLGITGEVSGRPERVLLPCPAAAQANLRALAGSGLR